MSHENHQYLISAAAGKLAPLAAVDYLGERAKRADLAEFDRLLAMVPNSTPDEGDEWPDSVEKTPTTSGK